MLHFTIFLNYIYETNILYSSLNLYHIHFFIGTFLLKVSLRFSYYISHDVLVFIKFLSSVLYFFRNFILSFYVISMSAI